MSREDHADGETTPPLPVPRRYPPPPPMLPLPPSAAHGPISPPRRNPGDSAREVARTATVRLIFETPDHLRGAWSLVGGELAFQTIMHHAWREEAWADQTAEDAGLRAPHVAVSRIRR